MRHLTLTLLVAATMLPTAAAAQDGPILLSPEAIGQIFCLSRIGNDMAPVEGLLAAGLTSAIAEAEAKSEAWGVAHPGDKPPLGDGVPWAEFPDYASECTTGAVAVAGSKALVTITYGFPEAPSANYSDELALIAVPDETIGANRWRIDNVLLADGYDLRLALGSAIDGVE